MSPKRRRDRLTARQRTEPVPGSSKRPKPHGTAPRNRAAQRTGERKEYGRHG